MAARAKTETPGQVLDAFFPPEVSVGDIAFAPFTIMHYLALEKVRSPLIAGEDEVAPPKPTTLDLLRALLIVSLQGRDLKALMARGDAALEDAALELACRIPAPGILGSAEAIVRHINAGFATALPAGGESAEDSPFPGAPAAADSVSRSG